jgi:hypothetical protein
MPLFPDVEREKIPTAVWKISCDHLSFRKRAAIRRNHTQFARIFAIRPLSSGVMKKPFGSRAMCENSRQASPTVGV